MIPSELLATSLSSDRIAALTSHKLLAIQTFYLNIWIFINHPRKRVFCNVSLSNLENLLQRNLRREWARECIFRVSGGTNFENFSARRQPWWRLRVFDVCTGLPKTTLWTQVMWKKELAKSLYPFCDVILYHQSFQNFSEALICSIFALEAYHFI